MWQREFPSNGAGYIITYNISNAKMKVWRPEETQHIRPEEWDLFYPCQLPEEPVFPEYLYGDTEWTKWPPDIGNYWAKTKSNKIVPIIVEECENRYFNVYLADGFGKLSNIPEACNAYILYTPREIAGELLKKTLRYAHFYEDKYKCRTL